MCWRRALKSTFDANAVGVSITSLIGSLGIARTAVSDLLLPQLSTGSRGGANRLFDEFKDYHGESQKKFQDQLDRITDRHEQMRRGYQEQVGRITDAQNLMLRDAIIAMKSVEKTMDNSTTIIQGIEKSLGALQMAVGAIDRSFAYERFPARSQSSQWRSEDSRVGFRRPGELQRASSTCQGPILLIIACVLSLFAIISFTINEFREKRMRQEAIFRERERLRAQDVRLKSRSEPDWIPDRSGRSRTEPTFAVSSTRSSSRCNGSKRLSKVISHWSTVSSQTAADFPAADQ